MISEGHRKGMSMKKKKQIFNKRCCMADFLGDCSLDIINAHTLSQGKQINPIIENGEFYVRGMNNSVEIEKTNSIKKVTIFRGFCRYHDKELFRVFEDEDFKSTQKQCCMLMFRSLSKELYNKRGGLNLFSHREEELIKIDSENVKIELNPFVEEFLSKEIIEGDKKAIREARAKEILNKHGVDKNEIELSIKDIEESLKRVKGQIENENYNSIRYFTIKVPELIDISFDTSFVPYIKEQYYGNKKHFESIVVSVLFEDGETFISFIWNKQYDFCNKFIENIKEQCNLKNAVYTFAFENSRELIIKESWWKGLTEEVKGGIRNNEYVDFGKWENVEVFEKI